MTRDPVDIAEQEWDGGYGPARREEREEARREAEEQRADFERIIHEQMTEDRVATLDGKVVLIVGQNTIQEAALLALRNIRPTLIAATDAFQTFGDAARLAALKFDEFKNIVIEEKQKPLNGIETLYLREHKRLPGGTSNARLRKKRSDKLAQWFFRL